MTLMLRLTTLNSATFIRPLTVLASIVRWREWYDSKLPLYLVAMFYGVLRTDGVDVANLGQMAAFFGLLGCYAAFGHIINDYADRTADRDAGKRRALANWGEPAARIAVAIPCVGALVIAFFAFTYLTFGLTVLAMLLAAFYSIPPVRLKERGLLGWAAATMAQRTLPVAIVFQAFGVWDAVAVGFVVLNTLIGLRFIIVHQLLDRANDQRAGIRTVATESDPRNLVSILHGLFALEIACACGVVAAMAYDVPLLGFAALVYACALAVLAWRGDTVSPRSYFVFYTFYCVIWPIALALPLAARNPAYLSALFVSVALVQGHARLRFRGAFLRLVTQPGHPANAASPARAPRSGQTEKLTITKADPYPYYARLRGTAAVVRVSWHGLGPTTWLVTRHREALMTLKDTSFVRDAANLTSGGITPPRRTPMRGFGHDLAELDPPDHTRLRKLVSLAFTPRMVQRFERRVTELADGILAQAIPRGEIELISEYASVLPIVTITELLGISIDNIQETRDYLHAVSLDGATNGDPARLAAWRGHFISGLETVFTARRGEPRDDLVTALVQAEQDGDRLSHDELVGMVFLLLLGGFVTTVNLIGNGMLALLRHPDQLDMLRRDPNIADTAVEELLRYDSPIELSPVCFAARAIELDGTLVPMGAPVRVLIPSANRDERVFANPDTLDITRVPCPHLSFGQGIHHCLGAPLARLQGKIALRKLLEHAPNPRLSDRKQVVWLPHPILRGLSQLPLRL